MDSSTSVPNYAWNCHACNEGNLAGSAKCKFCNCPSFANVSEIENYRRGNSLIKPRATLSIALWTHKWEWLLIIIGGAILAAILIVFIANKGVLDSAGWGQLGDFVGGYIATVFLLVSIALLLATFRNQSRSTKEQSFGNKYFEMVQMHRENVAEFEVGRMKGRKVFVSLVREFQEINRHVRKFTNSQCLQLSQEQYVIVAYFLLFFGVGANSSRMLRSSLIQFDKSFVDALIKYFELRVTQLNIREDAQLDYEPVDGHQSRLGHYYRHLFQTVNFVHLQTIDIDRYDYIKTVRAQLTNYEQAMLIINAVTPLGSRWIKSGLIKEYALVRNIPQNFFDAKSELDLDEILGVNYKFEWRDYLHA